MILSLNHHLFFQLFINKISDDVVTRGLQTVLSELELDFADNLILSFDKSASNKMIETTWKQAEKEVSYNILIYY